MRLCERVAGVGIDQNSTFARSGGEPFYLHVSLDVGVHFERRLGAEKLPHNA